MVMPWAEKQAITEPRANARRIAVLPFTNISPDPNDEYLADGMTEEMITKLSEASDLKVIARTSIMNYKGKEKSVSQIGKELAVGSIVEGSIRKAGNKIRVTVQLIDARTEEHLWASNYDRQLDDIFAIQDEVATKVAASLKAGVFSKTLRKDTDDIGAYTFYLKAMQLLPEETQPRIRESISLLEQAIADDPSFVRAHAGLSQAWAALAMGGYEDFLPAVTKAEEEARKALKLGPEWAESHAVMASVHSLLDRLNQSVEEAEKAIQINPNLAEAHISLGIQYTTFNRLDEAISEFQKAAELDPLSFSASHHLALAYRVAGRISESLEVLGKMRELNPHHPRIYSGLAESYMMKREFGTAQEMIDRAMKLSPDEPIVRLDQGLIYALTGRSKEAEETIEYMNHLKSEGARLYGQLFINTALGRLNPAFKALARQAEIHSWPFNIEVHPLFTDLRKDPRYLEFRMKVGLTNG
jgi:adenylate cyclase